MTDLNLTEFRQLLLAEQQSLRDAEADGKQSTETVQLDQSKVGRLSRMDALQGQAMAKATAQRRQQRLKNIALALQRIENDDYGFCDGCDTAIPEPRLRFDPAARYCVTCADKFTPQ